MNILIVEDEPPILRDIVSVIKSFNNDRFIIYATATNGQSAIELLQSEENKIDVVITDIHIPVFNGLELCEYIYNNTSYINTLLLTGYSKFEYAKKAIELGVTSYILKPLNELELKSQLENILNLREVKLHKQNIDLITKSVNDITDNYLLDKSQILIKVDSFICENYCKTINMKEISAMFGFTPAYLSKIFREYKNITPTDYITELRVKKAKELFLANPEVKVKDVALFLGYEDSLYFSKVFKKATKTSPREFLSSKK